MQMSLEHAPSKEVRRFRRKNASAYLKDAWGIDCAPKTLAKLASIGGGPAMEYAGRIPTYTQPALDEFAQAKLSPPVRNTAERQQQRQQLAA
jgi:hypothetical protein